MKTKENTPERAANQLESEGNQFMHAPAFGLRASPADGGGGQQKAADADLQKSPTEASPATKKQGGKHGDDYFDLQGHYLGTDGSTTSKIWVVTSTRKSELYKEDGVTIDAKKAQSSATLMLGFVSSQVSLETKQRVVLAIAYHYGKEVGVTKIGIQAGNAGEQSPAHYSPNTKMINLDPGYVSSSPEEFSDQFVFKNVLVHERLHAEDDLTNRVKKDMTFNRHATVYLNQMLDDTAKDCPRPYLLSMAMGLGQRLFNFLVQEDQSGGPETTALFAKFNRENQLQLKFLIQMDNYVLDKSEITLLDEVEMARYPIKYEKIDDPSK